MSSIAKYWPTIRQVVYGILAAGLAIAASAGWITDAQSEQWLAHLVTALGAVGFIVAGLFVDRTSPAQEQKIEHAVQVGVERAGVRVNATVSPPVVHQVREHVESAFDRILAERDRYLGG